jgi:hypothetical protein
MNAYSRTLPLVGGHGVTSPLRELGSSALDRRIPWAAPDPATMVLDTWGAPAARLVIRTVYAPWPAPDPSMRVEFAAPAALTDVGVSNLFEPFHPIEMPDIIAARQAAWPTSVAARIPVGRPLPPPTIADAAVYGLAPTATSVGAHRRGATRRLAVGLVAAAGVACAAVAAAVTLL